MGSMDKFRSLPVVATVLLALLATITTVSVFITFGLPSLLFFILGFGFCIVVLWVVGVIVDEI